MASPAIYRRSNSASVFASSNQFPYREHPQSRLAAVLRSSLGQHNNGPTARPPIVSIISSAPRPRPPMRRRTFLEELELHEDPSYYIEQIQLKPGRTPTANEIIRRRLLGRVKLPNEKSLLPQIRPADVNKKCLIIDLDETLVHSSFKPVKNPDFVIPVEIDGVVHQVYVLKRPYVDEFLARVGDRFECVLFTASLAKYADPVADLLDKRGVFRSRLFREACVYHKGNYVKDLARLGRDLSKTIIIDNSPASYSFHPSNAIPVQTWFDDPTDVELLDILPLLDRLEKVDSVYDALNGDDTRPDNLLERNGINS